MDSTNPRPKLQPQIQIPPQQQQIQQSHPQHQPHHQHQHHHHYQRPSPAGPNIPQQPLQHHIQPQSLTPQVYTAHNQHAQTAGYPTPIQYATYQGPYQRLSSEYHYEYPYDYSQPNFLWTPQPAPTYNPAQIITPTSQDLSNTTRVSVPETPLKRDKVLLEIKNPHTGKLLDLKAEEALKDSSKSTSTTKTSSTQPSPATITAPKTSTTVAKSSPATGTAATATKKDNPSIAANANDKANTITTSSNEKTNASSQPIQTLLQKVSEDTNSDKRQGSGTKAATITRQATSASKTVNPAATKPANVKTEPSPVTPTTADPVVTSAPAAAPAGAPTAPTAAPTAPTAAAPPTAAPAASLSESIKDVKTAKKSDLVEKTVLSQVPTQTPVSEDAKLNNTNGNDPQNTETDIKPEKGDSKDVEDAPSQDEQTKIDAPKQDGDDSTKSGEKVELHYEPGQYNPYSNRLGTKKYSRDFLIDVCEKVCKLSVFDDDKEDNSMDNYSFANQVDMFAPQFSKMKNYPQANRQNDQSRRQNQQNYIGRSSAGQERQRKVISSYSLTQEVELKTVANPWRPGKEVKEDKPTDVVEVEDLKKKFRSILNKLTPNNFDNLSNSVTELHIDTESKLGEVIDIVFAKALAEPGYCTLYGQMCSHLKKITAGTTNFGNTLLKRCQNQFQSDIYSGLNLDERKKKIEEEESAEVKKQLNDELYEDMYRCRMRGLGLIKFIGELYKIEMLNDQIMFDCIIRLLNDTSEESLECLCDLLVTIGEKLDRSRQNSAREERKAQKGPSRTNAYQSGKSAASVVASGGVQHRSAPEMTLDDIFDQLHKIRKNKDLPISLRIRFKLLDVCELREKDNWQSKKTKDNNPKKIEEIREAHNAKLDAERRKDAAMGARRSQEGRRGLGHSSGSSSQISSLANESGNRGGASMHASASSHSIRDHPMDDNMKQNHSAEYEIHKQQSKAVLNLLSQKTLPNQADSSLRPTSAWSKPSGLRPYSNRSGGGGASSNLS